MRLLAGFFGFIAFFGVVLGAAAVRHATALTYHEATETCPLDGQEFTYQAVASYTRFGTQLDLKPVGALVAPVPLPVCPASGFVMYRDDFSEEDIAFFRDLVTTSEYKALRARHSDYYVAAWQAGQRGEELFDLAFLTLQASWEVDQDPKRYEEYARAALSRFRAYDRSGAAVRESQEWWTAKLLIVNLYRRLGEFDKAADLLAELQLIPQQGETAYGPIMEQLGRLISERKGKPAEIG